VKREPDLKRIVFVADEPIRVNAGQHSRASPGRWTADRRWPARIVERPSQITGRLEHLAISVPLASRTAAGGQCLRGLLT
jgi:hypothetical protein